MWIRPPETGAAYHGGVGTRGKRIYRGYTLDTRPEPSASKRVFNRGGRHRRNWRQHPYYVRSFGKTKSLYAVACRSAVRDTRQGQPKKYISAQRDMMDLKGGLFVFETKMTLDRS